MDHEPNSPRPGEAKREFLAREPAEQQAELLELAHDAILVREYGTSLIRYWNQGAERLYGWSRAEAIDRTSHELLRTRFPCAFEEVEAELARTGRWEGELVHTRRDGSRLVVDSRWSVRRDERGQPVAYLEINTDITDRKLSEERRLQLVREQTARAEAEAAEKRVSRILESIGDGFFALDTSWRFEYVNREAELLLGRQRSELLGQTLWTALPEFRALGLEEQYRAAAAEGKTDLAFDAYYPARHAWYSLRVYSGPDGLSVYLRDDTQRRREAEGRRVLDDTTAHLADSLDYTRTLRSLPRLLVPRLADYALVDLLTDEGHLERLAAAHADPSLEPLLSLGRVYTMSREADGPMDRVLRTGKPTIVDPISAEWLASAIRPTPEQQHAAEHLAPRSSMLLPLVARGRTLGLLTLVSTGSERHYDERDLSLGEEVARRCALAIDNARLYAAAQQALLEAEAAIRVRDDVLATVSHDLKTPLTAVRGTSELVARRVGRMAPGPEVDRLLEGLERIRAASTRMERMMNELLDAAHLQTGEPLVLQREAVDLVKLVREALAEQQSGTARHTLRLVSDVDALVGEWDGQRLRRVLDNLLSNAVKYSPDGGEIVVQLAREEDWAVLLVSDQGLGIPADDLPHIFERFRRARNATEIVGTGLGLSGARQLVEQHGGTIVVHSQEGAGSTFTIRLPLRDTTTALGV
jgi:PAS domain S-box-containing protein